MQDADTRSKIINGAIRSEDAAGWNVAIKGSMTGRDRGNSACALSNLTASTALHVGYVDAGKSTFVGDNIGGTVQTADDWQFSFVRLGSGTQKYAPTCQEFSLGETLVNSAANAEQITWGTTVANAYYVVKIFLPVAAVATLTQCALIKCGRRQTDTTHITIPAGESTFMVQASNTAADITLAGTGGNDSLVYVYLVTAWTGGQCQIDY